MKSFDAVALAVDDLSLNFTSAHCIDKCETRGDPPNVVDGLFAIASGLNSIAAAIQNLGNGNASTPMGAIENLAKELKEGLEHIADSVHK